MNAFEILRADSPRRELKKLSIQIYPSKTRIVPNDKFAKKTFNMEDETSTDLLNGATLSLIEKRNHKNIGDIQSHYQFHTSSEYVNYRPLTQFDLAVLSVCISEWQAGNAYTTVAIIYRALTGKIDKGSSAKPSSVQRAYIIDSIRKLMGTIVTADTDDLCEYLKYNNGESLNFSSALLPACYIEAYLGGDDITVIFFDRISPVLELALAKGQLLSYDATLLDVPNQNNSPMNIVIKNYVMIRVQEIKLHKLTPTITFDDVFKKCRIQNASRKTQMDARETVETFMKHLKAHSVIKTFELTKKRNKFYSVTFKY